MAVNPQQLFLFFKALPPVVIYGAVCALMSLILFVLMGYDKLCAIKGWWRVSEMTLFFFAVFGGAAGGTLGMFLFRHKTKHMGFVFFFPVFLICQLAGGAYLFLK